MTDILADLEALRESFAKEARIYAKQWRKSFCTATGKNTHITRIKP